MSRALEGLRVVVPLTSERAAIADRVEREGAEVMRVEAIAFAAPADPAAVDAAVARFAAGRYDWLAVTSRVAVNAIAASAAAQGLDLGARPGGRVAAVGASTASACAGAGFPADLVPDGATDAARLVEAFPVGEGTVLAPLGNLAAPTLRDGLAAKGWTVDAIEAYRTIDGPPVDPAILLALGGGTADALVLTSGSVAVRIAREAAPLAPSVAVVAMGRATAKAAQRAGLAVTAVAAEPSPDGVVAALAGLRKEPT